MSFNAVALKLIINTLNNKYKFILHFLLENVAHLLILIIFALAIKMVVVAQLVRALVCGTRGRRFEPGLPPLFKSSEKSEDFFLLYITKKKFL